MVLPVTGRVPAMNRRRVGVVASIVMLLAGWLAMPVVRATGQPSAGTPHLQPVLSGLSSPVYVTSARDGTRRLFILEQGGSVKVLPPGASSPSVFLDITGRVLSGGERGLLGLAFHPRYVSNRRFFVNYTRQPDGATVIAEYTASAANRDVANPTESVLLVIPQPFANHNGGMIEFGPDGFLYIGMGDGGSANDPGNRAQNPEDLLGKILRIDVDRPDGAVPYSSPPDNPFFGARPGRDEIYALGFRNPFRGSFDRGTGQLIVGDVGQGAREEVNVVVPGGNYGWRVFEGTLCTSLDPQRCVAGSFVPPIAEYAHEGGRCSIIGGYVYRGARSTLAPGSYVFGDFCTGEIFLLDRGVPTGLVRSGFSISSFGEDEDGEIYVVGLQGTLHRLASGEPRSGSITAAPNPVAACDGSGLGVTTLSWVSTGASIVEVRLGSPSGPPFARTGPSGTATTGKWVTQGMTFFLQDVSDGRPLTPDNTLATVTMTATTSRCVTGSIAAAPNPIPACDGSGLGATTLSWAAPGTSALEIRLGSPSGPPFARTGSSGQSATGKWVTEGMTFFLLDISDGAPPTASSTHATVVVNLTTAGCAP